MASPMVEALQVPTDRIIVAYDGMEWDEARGVGRELGDITGVAKANDIALEYGWDYTVAEFEAFGQLTMGDEKFHDTPDTVRKELYRMTRMGVGMITVHASGGIPMMKDAVVGRDRAREDLAMDGSERKPGARRLYLPLRVTKERVGNILAITILTSLDDDEVNTIYGIGSDEWTVDREKKSIEFAYMAAESGVDALVCSGAAIKGIRARRDLDRLALVVPGQKLPNGQANTGQKSITTPDRTIELGGDFVVMGTAVTNAPEASGMSVRAAAELTAELVTKAAA